MATFNNYNYSQTTGVAGTSAKGGTTANWININSYVSIGIIWNATVTDTKVTLEPAIWRWNSNNTNNSGDSWSFYMSPDPTGTGTLTNSGWTGAFVGAKEIRAFSVGREYTRGTSNTNVLLRINLSSLFGTYYSGAFQTLGAQTLNFYFVVPAKEVEQGTLVMSVSPTGAGTTSPSGTKTYDKGTDVTLSATPASGYTFSYWSFGGYGTSTSNPYYHTIGSGTDYITAYFTRITYAISYNLNGGDYGLPSSQTKTHGTTLTLSSSTPSRYSESTTTGYTVTYNYNGGSGSVSSNKAADYRVYSFSSWNTNSGGTGTTYYAGGSYTTNASATLYAQWSSYIVDGDVTLPTPNSRTGYTFGGWYTSTSYTTKAGNAGVSYTPSSSLTLYAKWTGNSYTVTYNGNGATSGSMSNSSHVYGTSSALSMNQYVKSGYKFLGWSTSSTATTATYTDGQSVSTLTSTNGGNVTLYAVWEQSGNVISVYDSSGIKHTGLVTAYDANGNKHSVVISAYDSSGAKHNVT